MPEDKKMAKEDQEMADDPEVCSIIFLIINEFYIFYYGVVILTIIVTKKDSKNIRQIQCKMYMEQTLKIQTFVNR